MKAKDPWHHPVLKGCPSTSPPRFPSNSGGLGSPTVWLDACPSSPALLQLGPSSASLTPDRHRTEPWARAACLLGTCTQSNPAGEDTVSLRLFPHSEQLSPGCTVPLALRWGELIPVVLGVCGYSDKSWCILHGIKILRLFIFITGLSFGSLHTPWEDKVFEMLRRCSPLEQGAVPRATLLPLGPLPSQLLPRSPSRSTTRR